VIGAGSGGLNVASFFASINMNVLLVDKNESSLGGDCLNTGCVPSKSFIHVASCIHSARQLQTYGLGVSGGVDITKVMDEVKSKQNTIRVHESSDAFAKKGIEVKLGHASFTGSYSIAINDEEVSFDACVLATGSRARTLSIKSDDSVRIFSNENIFDIEYLPKEFVFIGGGPIGCELGQAFARLGSHVTILNTQDRILPREEPEVSSVLASSFEKDRVTIINNATLVEIKEKTLSYTIQGSEEVKPISTDAIFVGIGRALNIENLDLEKAGIACDEKFSRLIINECLQTTNADVYAVGDVAGSFMFTHAAEEHAKVVINNLLSPMKKKMPKTMPWVTFTSPQVATFGKQKSDLEKESVVFDTLEASFANDDRAITDGAREGFVCVYLDSKRRLLGGTMVGDDAGELVQELLLLQSANLPISALFDKVYPYPSKSRINRSLAVAYAKRRLTETNKKLLRILFKLFH
jgi:pyruvate/2-oxoglutarate dehydrogenase complex dihydrolipoamide dehydrogenase (E3) component